MLIEQIIGNRAPDDILTCEPDMPVRDAVALLAGKRIGALPIVDETGVVGIFSERDVIYRLASDGAMCLDRPVGEVMTSPAITVEKGQKGDHALALMTKRRIRHLPVVDGNRLVGFVSIGDLVKSQIDEVEHEASSMRAYIQTA